jgi:hypothetical protein
MRAEDDSGQWVRYSYNPDGMLADVISFFRPRASLSIRRLSIECCYEIGISLGEPWKNSNSGTREFSRTITTGHLAGITRKVQL